MKRKLLCIVLAGCLTAVMLAGCGGSASQEEGAGGAAAGGEASAADETAKAEESDSAETGAEDSEDKKMIGIVPWDMGMAFESDLAAIAEEECAARGWESVVMDPKGDWAQMYTFPQRRHKKWQLLIHICI